MNTVNDKNRSVWRLLTVAILVMPASVASAQNSSLLRRVPTQPYVTSGQTGQISQPAAVGVPARPVAMQIDPQQLGLANQPPGINAQPSMQRRPEYDVDSQPLQLEQTSFLYQAPPPQRKFQINDPVTIRVDEITRMMAEGGAENRKITQFQAVLSDWLRLDNGRLRPDPQGFGDPTVAGDTSSIYRAEATTETRESMTFTITAKVVDIRPNGNLVLEANKRIRANDNVWEKSLTGICRAQDIAPDNVVLSRDLLDMNINNQDRGQLRDGYKRGWFTRWFDRLQPF